MILSNIRCNKTIILTVFVLLFFHGTIYTQVEQSSDTTQRRNVFFQKNLSIQAGINFWKYTYVELGLAKNTITILGHHGFGLAGILSSEIWIEKHPIWGFKTGVWGSGGSGAAAIGLNLIYYTDFANGSLRLRPEIGYGFIIWKAVYGYNIPLTNKDFNRVNKHVVSIVFLLGVKKLKSYSY